MLKTRFTRLFSALLIASLLLASIQVVPVKAQEIPRQETGNFTTGQDPINQLAVSCYTLTTAPNIAGRGTISANPAPNCNGGTQYTSGTVVQLTANPAVGYGFSTWSGSVSGSSNPVSVTMSSNRSATANFLTCYTLTTAPNFAGRGTISANPGPNCNSGTQYISGTVVQLTAHPAAAYGFSSWSGSIASTANPVSVTMTTNRSITANFLACYTLTTAPNIAGRGTISANPAPNCPDGRRYLSDTVVQLTANPAVGYGFSTWSGSVSGSSNPVSVTMSSNRSATANFLTCYTLTTAPNFVGRGTIGVSPAPNCNSGTQYISGTVVKLTANPAAGYGFSSWSGSIASTSNPVSVTMTTNRSITANFLACYTLTTAPNIAGRGTISANPAPNCSSGTRYLSGTVVQLTANPAVGYGFSTWSGSVSGSSNPVSVTMSSNRSATANFLTCYTLTTTANDPSRGTISANPGPNCNSGTQYISGTVVQLTANPAAGYGLSSWSGSIASTSNPVSVTMSTNRSITANFSTCYTLTIVPDPDPTLIVDASPAPNCNGGTKYTAGTVVQLTAHDGPGWTFHQWTNDLTGTANPSSVTMNSDKEVWAVYSPVNCYTLTVTVDPDPTLIVDASPAPNCNEGTQYTEGTVVQLTAHNGPGWTFDQWGWDLGGSANPQTITMDSDHNVLAVYAIASCYTLNLVVDPPGDGSITANPAPDCNNATQYTEGTVVQLTANNDQPCWAFSQWTTDLTGTTNPDSVTMNSDKEVWAVYSNTCQ